MPNGRHGARAAPSKPLPSHGGLGPCLPPTPGPHLCTSGARQKKYHATGLEYRAFVLSVTDAMYLTEREREQPWARKSRSMGSETVVVDGSAQGRRESGGNRTKERASERGAELSTAVFKNKARRRTLCTHPCTWPSSPHRSRKGRRRASPGRWATSQGQQAWCPWPQTSSRTWPESSQDQARSAARTTRERGVCGTGATLRRG